MEEEDTEAAAAEEEDDDCPYPLVETPAEKHGVAFYRSTAMEMLSC